MFATRFFLACLATEAGLTLIFLSPYPLVFCSRGEGEIVGFQFKPKLSAVLAVLNGVSVGLADIVSQGNITATII
jgi:hypothetical protein